MSDFIEGNHPGAYDGRGNFNGNLPEAPAAPAVPAEARMSLRDHLRAKIAAAPAYQSQLVHVDEWDADVEVRSMSLGERNAITQAVIDSGGKSDLVSHYPRILISACYTPDGEKLFTEEDNGWLNSLPAGVVDKLAEPAMKLNGMGESQSLEPIVKKSDSTGTGD